MTVVLTVAICVMAASIAKRAFWDRPDEGPPPSLSFEADWQELLAVGRRIGSATAPIQIIEVADLQCPGCRGYQRILDDVLNKYADRVAVVFIHYPLDYHTEAMVAHRGAECALRSDRFAEFIRGVYAKQESLPHRPIWAFAKDAGVPDSAAFGACVADTASVDRAIEAASIAIEDFEITNTPTIIVNGWRYSGLPQKGHLDDLIDDLIDGKSPRPDSMQGD